MRHRGQTVRGFTRMINNKVNTEIEGLVKTGTIVRTGGRKAFVKFDGSVAIKPVDLMCAASAGDRCVLMRPSEQHRWMVMSASSPTAQPPPEFNPSMTGELSPPSNFTTSDMLPGIILWQWDAPPQKPVAFELQHNTTATAVDATQGIITRGSHFMLESGNNLFARVRSLGAHFERSAWSVWLEGTPGVTGVTGTGVSDAADVTYTEGDGTDWIGDPHGFVAPALDELAGRIKDAEDFDATLGSAAFEDTSAFAAAGHAHDADDVTYAPADNTDWDGSADPGDVADALDQLAERVSTAEDDIDGHTHVLADVTDAGTMAAQDADAVAITGGTVNDLTALSATRDTTTLEVMLSNFGAAISAFLHFRRGRGTAGGAAMVEADDQLGALGASGYDSGLADFPTSPPARFAFFADEDYDGGGRGASVSVDTTPIGSTSRAVAQRWFNGTDTEFKGKIRALGALGTAQGRLTLTSGTPVAGGVSGATTLYYTPYIGNGVWLYNGATWDWHTFTERSISLASAGAGGSPIGSGTNYDVWLYNNVGTLTLELLAWTSDIARATALAYQNGVLVKSGDATRLYLGSIRGSASGQCSNSATNQSVWNNYNRVPHRLAVESTNSHTYNSTTQRAWDNDTTLRVQVLWGVAEGAMTLALNGRLNGNGTLAYIGIGKDSTSVVIDTNLVIGQGVTGDFRSGIAHVTPPDLGYHYFQMIERGNGTPATFQNAYLYGSIPS